MDGAAVAVCLISADYLTSDFCEKEEIPYLLKRRRNRACGCFRSCCVPARGSRPLAQANPDPAQRQPPHRGLSSAKREQIFAEIAESIGQSLAQPAARKTGPLAQPGQPSPRRRRSTARSQWRRPRRRLLEPGIWRFSERPRRPLRRVPASTEPRSICSAGMPS